MTVTSIKALLKSSNIEATNEQIKQKISELGLSVSSLGEDGITKVVDSFIGSALAAQTPQSKSDISINNQIENAKKKLKSGLSDKLKSDIAAFEQPIADFSERVSSDEAHRIYEQHIVCLPDKVKVKTAELISNYQGDTKRNTDDGQFFAAALFSDFSANT